MNEIGVNPWEGYSNAEIAAALAESMHGLVTDFENLVDEVKSYAGDYAEEGYQNFKEENSAVMETVQENGLRLADSMHDGAVDAAKSDYEASEYFDEAWSNIPEPKFK